MNYKEQIIITRIEVNIWCPICYSLLKKKRNKYKIVEFSNSQVNLKTT